MESGNQAAAAVSHRAMHIHRFAGTPMLFDRGQDVTHLRQTGRLQIE